MGTEQHSIRFTKPELDKLHLHFFHPSTGKLFNLLKRVNPKDTNDSVKQVLDDIAKACSTCSEYHSSPFHFRAAIPPDELIFHHALAIDLIWLKKNRYFMS